MNQVGEITPQDMMIRQQIIERGITDERVDRGHAGGPARKVFPERIQRETAYADRAAPIGHGQTISQPYMVALMTTRLQVAAEHKVLEIGTGSGYQTAIFASWPRGLFHRTDQAAPGRGV